MGAEQQEATAKARELQRTWYGEPLGALFRRLIDDLGLNQARLAAVLGLSAPMLSQLMSGQRAKIGNPAVVQRVQALQELAGQVADGSVSAAEAAERMDEIRKSSGGSMLSPTSSQSTPSSGVPTVRRVVREIQSLLRSVAAAGDIIAAADALAADHPELAEFLRVYGAGKTGDAVAHYEAHQG
ncbi:helix-turn-helix domain-containing protein [Streptomyces sp. TP-A0874]|uniref:helix-turn-helix domain-containing protein n=1 Tax=Streptomyces sp. TP-A0874 TaxID=549819 RepID=UPI00085302FB|nr:DNA-binding protein [Streptomyces sp. TP-A0874]